MSAFAKTDNHNPAAKLELRRYFLRKYHAAESPSTLDVLDCCQGSGLLWRALKKEFTCDSYLGVDLKPQKGRLKIDSVRILDQPGWKFNCVDVDTYGSPWKHWFALVRHFPNFQSPDRLGLTVFLTIGIVNIGGIATGADKETLRSLGLDDLFSRFKDRAVKPPPSLTGRVRDRSGVAACLSAVSDFSIRLVDLMEAENIGGNARYIGARLERSPVGG